MKTFTIASVVALASVASAQLGDLPGCAVTCLVPALSSDGCSAITDFKCHCEKGASLIGTVQPCIQSGCSIAEQQTALTAIASTCASAGVPIDLPNAPTSSAAAVSSAAAPAVSSASAAVSSVQSAASSAVASAASSLASRASTAAASASASAASASPSASPSQFTGGAPQATRAAGLLGVAAIAMLAL